jgi:hypothetical protein
MTHFDVSTENAVYSSLDGVLYNKDRTELLFYPIGKTDNSFAIPKTVTTLAEAAGETQNIQAGHLPAGVYIVRVNGKSIKFIKT